MDSQKDDVIPRACPKSTRDVINKTDILGKDSNSSNGPCSSITQKILSDLNDELSEFSDHLNFRSRSGLKRPYPENSIEQTKSLFGETKNILSPKPSEEDLYQTLFDKPAPKEITSPAPKSDNTVRPINPLKPYYDISSLHARKRQHVGNNIVFQAFSHKRRRLMDQRNAPQQAGIYYQTTKTYQNPRYNATPQYGSFQKQPKRDFTSTLNQPTINQFVLIELTSSQQPSSGDPATNTKTHVNRKRTRKDNDVSMQRHQ